MASILGIAAVGLAMLGGAGWWFSLMDQRARRALQEWATEEGLELVEVSLRPIAKGPYWFATKAQMVYRVTGRGADGSERSGWVRSGGPLGGPAADTVDVKWDETASPDG